MANEGDNTGIKGLLEQLQRVSYGDKSSKENISTVKKLKNVIDATIKSTEKYANLQERINRLQQKQLNQQKSLASVGNEILLQEKRRLHLEEQQKRVGLNSKEIKELTGIDTRLRTLINSREELIKDEKESLKIIQQQRKAYNDLNSPFKTGLRNIAEWTAASAVAKESAVAFGKTIELAAQKAIVTGKSFDQNFGTTILNIGKEAINTSYHLTGLQFSALKLGFSMDEASGMFSDVTLNIARVGDGSTITAEQVGSLSSNLLYYSRVLNIDSKKATDFARDRMLKYGGTVENVADDLSAMRQVTEKLNKGTGKTILTTTQVADSVMDAAKSANVYNVNFQTMALTTAAVAEKIAAMGGSLEQVQNIAKGLNQMLVKPPKWIAFYAGEKLAAELEKVAPDKLDAELQKKFKGSTKEQRDLISSIVKDKSLVGHDKYMALQQATGGFAEGQENTYKTIKNRLLKTAGGASASVLVQQGIAKDELEGVMMAQLMKNEDWAGLQKLKGGEKGSAALTPGEIKSSAQFKSEATGDITTSIASTINSFCKNMGDFVMKLPFIGAFAAIAIVIGKTSMAFTRFSSAIEAATLQLKQHRQLQGAPDAVDFGGGGTPTTKRGRFAGLRDKLNVSNSPVMKAFNKLGNSSVAEKMGNLGGKLRGGLNARGGIGAIGAISTLVSTLGSFQKYQEAQTVSEKNAAVGGGAGGIAGTIIGGIFGGPLGAAAGAQIGDYLGTVIGGKFGTQLLEAGNWIFDKLTNAGSMIFNGLDTLFDGIKIALTPFTALFTVIGTSLGQFASFLTDSAFARFFTGAEKAPEIKYTKQGEELIHRQEERFKKQEEDQAAARIAKQAAAKQNAGGVLSYSYDRTDPNGTQWLKISNGLQSSADAQQSLAQSGTESP